MKKIVVLLSFLALATIMFVVTTACATAPVGREQLNWEAVLTEMYPGARSLDIMRFRNRWGSHVFRNYVTWDGSNFHDVTYTFPADIRLDNYEALLLVMEVYDIRKPRTHPSETYFMSFNFRKGPSYVPHPDPDNRLLKQFILADYAGGIRFPEHGIFIAGIHGSNFTRMINDPVHGRGFNMQNAVWAPPDAPDPNIFRTGYTMRIHAVMLLPRRDTSGFGARGGEFILDPMAFNRAGQWGSMDAAGNLLIGNGGGAINYVFPSDLVRGDFTTLVIDYTILDKSLEGDISIFIAANDHTGPRVVDLTLTEPSGRLEIELPEFLTTGFSIRNDMSRLGSSLAYIIKINSLKLR